MIIFKLVNRLVYLLLLNYLNSNFISLRIIVVRGLIVNSFIKVDFILYVEFLLYLILIVNERLIYFTIKLISFYALLIIVAFIKLNFRIILNNLLLVISNRRSYKKDSILGL